MAIPDFTSTHRLPLCRAGGILAIALGVVAPAWGASELMGPPSEFALVESEGAGSPATSNAPVNIGAGEDEQEVSRTPVVSRTESLPLGRATPTTLDGGGALRSEASPAGAGWWLQTTAALALVIGLILTLKWGAQRVARRASGIAWQMGPAGRAPSGVLEVLGRYPVSRGQSLVLLKMDRRILLLGQTAAGFSTLSEVSDPEEVASLLVKTRDDEGASQAARFNELLRDMERDPAIGADTQEIQSGEPATGPRLPRIGLRGVTA